MYAPHTELACQPPGVYSNRDFPAFRRIPSLSDYREEMTTFSSLPTSYFTLKPSSSDTEPDETPMSYWNQSVASDKYLDSSSWNWNQPCTGFGNEKYWQRPSVSSNSRNNNNSPHLSSAPANYGGYHPNSTVKQKSNQQVHNYENASDQSVKDVSRSSLSVTDSKKIILTTPTPSSHFTPTGEKKKTDDKVQPPLNHKLVGGAHKRGLTPSVERPTRKPLPVGTNPVVDPRTSGACVDEVSKSKSTGDAKSVASFGAGQTKGNGGLTGGVGLEQNKKARTVASVNAVKEAASGSCSNGGVKDSSSGINGGVSTSSSVPGILSSTSVKERLTPSNLKHVATKEKEPAEVDVWAVNGPASLIRSLNISSKKDRILPKRLNKKGVAISATLESAKLVTSKFCSKATARKREDSGSSSSACAAADVPLSLPPPAQGPGGVLIHASANSRSGSSTPTIIDGMLAQQKLGALSTVMAAGLSGVKVTELPSAKAGESAIISGGGGVVDVKRTNTNSLPDGIMGHVTSQQVDHVTASVGTNGTNFQEMFSSTKRKLSESTERGLKQALAG